MSFLMSSLGFAIVFVLIQLPELILPALIKAWRQINP